MDTNPSESGPTVHTNGAPSAAPVVLSAAKPAPRTVSLASASQVLPTVEEKIGSFPMGLWIGFLVLVIALGIAIVGLIPAAANSAANSALVLAYITGTSLVIERLLEAFWNYFDASKGAWWPFNVVHDYIEHRVENFQTYVQPYLDRLSRANDLLNELHKDDPQWKPALDNAAADVTALPDRLTSFANDVKKLNLGNDAQLDYLLTRTSDSVKSILAAHPDLQAQLGKKVDLAKEMTDGVYGFVQTFNDNPARRIISLVIGCFAGFVVAGFLRLDLFTALGVINQSTSPAWSLGVPLTGLIMGLGSNPTHEIIQAIQQYKSNSASSSTST
jgi:hypothetical protein